MKEKAGTPPFAKVHTSCSVSDHQTHCHWVGHHSCIFPEFGPLIALAYESVLNEVVSK